jgi:hypothetical protein
VRLLLLRERAGGADGRTRLLLLQSIRSRALASLAFTRFAPPLSPPPRPPPLPPSPPLHPSPSPQPCPRSWAVSGAVQKLSVSIGDLATAAVSFSEVETNEIDTLNTLSTAELSKDGGANSVPNVLSRQAQLLSSALSCLSPCPDAINLLFIEALE